MTAARTSVSGLQELSADQSEEQNADLRTVQENIEGNAAKSISLKQQTCQNKAMQQKADQNRQI